MTQSRSRLSILLNVGVFLVGTLTVSLPSAYADGGSCGDQGSSCGQEERCCEHQVAIFGNDGASSPTFKEGKCVAKEQRCSDYWCGNRHCEGGLFGTPNVCCVNQVSDSQTAYKCAYNELNCPGNQQQLRIRPPQVASANLQN